MSTMRLAHCFGLLAAAGANAFYLPGAAPRNYAPGEKVDLFVNALTPILSNRNDSKLKSLINYDYYNPRFHFCQPEGGPIERPEGLGSILFGDRIFTSPYKVKMLEHNGTCQTLCTQEIPAEDSKFINDRIREDYALNWLIDGLPAAEFKKDLQTGDVFYDMGFNLGNDEDQFEDMPALHNHYEVVLKYHTPTPGQHRVVGVLVWPDSVGGNQEGEATCGSQNSPPLVLSETLSNKVRYTYRIRWEESDTPWATRWDNYLHILDPKIHWFSLLNFSAIVVFLCFMVSMVVARSVSRDISRYNAVDLSEDIQEDWGWKLVHGEVFRAPQYPLLLSVMVGNGAQLCAMVAITLVFALLGFLSPSNRGSLATVMMVCWSFFGSIGGYISSRVYTSIGGENRRKNAFVTATVLPTFVFAIVFLLNLFLITAGSSGAVPFGTLLLIIVLWFGISAPLSAVGSYYGSKHGPITHPVRVNQIPRQIPPAPKYLRPWPSALISGVLPFGAAFVELYFVFQSLFASRAYYAFGFLTLTSAIVALITGTVTILFVYFLLCAEEYRWHWRSFFIGGASAFWLLVYGTYYGLSRMSLHSLSGVLLYSGYLILLAVLDFLITGTIGFLASYWAVRKLYSAIRVD